MTKGTIERAWQVQCANDSCTAWALETNYNRRTAATRFRTQWDYVGSAGQWWCAACAAERATDTVVTAPTETGTREP